MYSPVEEITADQLKVALVGLRERIESFILDHGAAEVLSGSTSILARMGIQRFAGADVLIHDGVRLVDASGMHEDVLIEGEIVYLTTPQPR